MLEETQRFARGPVLGTIITRDILTCLSAGPTSRTNASVTTSQNESFKVDAISETR